MGSQMEQAKRRLFDAESLNVDNVKLFPGGNREATPEAMAEQVNKALAQITADDYEEVVQFED